MATVQESLSCLLFYPIFRIKHHPTIDEQLEEGMHKLLAEITWMKKVASTGGRKRCGEAGLKL
jgi:hypothetical protein